MNVGRLKFWKAEETAEHVVYLYGPTQKQVGRLSINKKDGAIRGEGVSGMSEESSWHYFGLRARAYAEKLFALGIYPEEDEALSI
jgi:hypothetical protein